MTIIPLNAIDFYKADHRRQYPPGTSFVYSNWTPRVSKYLPQIQEVTLFGLQKVLMELNELWKKGFFSLPKNQVLSDYRRRMDSSLGPGAIPLDHVADLHDLGFLPLRVKALPEGTAVPIGVPMFTIENTIDRFFWLTNYLETYFSTQIWLACTSATIAKEYRRVFNEYADATVGNRDFCRWQGHDFSERGMASIEAAAMSGAAHLLSFQGTDTVPAIDLLEQYYRGLETFVGGSVAATEHSVMCMGTQDGELSTFRRLITEVYPKGIVSIVSDTWDFWQVITEFLPALRNIIMNRDGKVVIRPDSGDPVKIIIGDPDALPGSPEFKGAIECMAETFGTTTNALGYKELPPCIGLIYGDSITLNRQKAILEGLKLKGFASNCVVLGIGSYTYQYQTRDTFGFAMKATYGIVNDEGREIFKLPKTGDGTKNSLRGLIAVKADESGKLYAQDQQDWEIKPEQRWGGLGQGAVSIRSLDSSASDSASLLNDVYYDGDLVGPVQSLAEIRDRMGVW